MKSVAKLLGLIALANLMVMALFFSAVFEWLDEAQMTRIRAEQDEILNASRRLFLNQPSETWQQARLTLESEHDAFVSFLERNSGDVPLDVLPRLDNRMNKQGMVIEELASIYMPLDDLYVLEVQQVGSSKWVEYLVEIVLFFSLLIATLLSAGWYVTRQAHKELKLKQQLAQSVGTSNARDKELEHLLQQLHSQQEETSQMHQRQLAAHKDLLHGVAHELRSPMARIQFALDMLPEQPGSEYEELKTSIDNNLAELDKMIAELLNYARLQHAGALDVTEQVNCTDVCQDAVDAVAPIYHNVVFELSGAEELPLITGHHALLCRAVTNLLRNAGRYAKQCCQISLSYDKGCLTICVDDDGEGIPPGKRERVFEPFTRLDPSRSRDSGGSGLGLAIVSSISELHHGRVYIEDSALGGARFVLVLPV